ncbi:MAG TPA: TOBE-like domain-containing protein [Pirellulales bacterium]
MSITIKNLTKRFGDFVALENISLEMPGGALTALLGPSGSGKTTLLRIIAGLEAPDEGCVLYREEDVTSREAKDRNVGFVFQHYALFRHMTVFENVAFGLRVRNVASKIIRERVNELLSLVKLAPDAYAKRYPHQLSGGQRQRVALARALAAQPDLILLDEPFAALDAKVRVELRQWLRRLHKELSVNCVFVTHDQEEAFEVADYVVVMNKGRVEQVGSPAQVFDHPANAFVMDFLGNVNVFHGRVHNGKALLGGWEVEVPDHAQAQAQDAQLYIRPHELDVSRQPAPQGLAARVLHVNPAGSITKVQLQSADGGLPIQVDLTQERQKELELRPGEDVFVVPRRVRVFLPANDYCI